MVKKIKLLIYIFFLIMPFNNVFADEGDFEYVHIIKASNGNDNFYSFVGSGANTTFNIQVDSDRHVLGTEPTKVLVMHACSINLTDMKINNIGNRFGYVSQQGATIYNSVDDCTFYLSGTKYFGTYQYWYFPIQQSYFNDGDGTYNLNFDVDIYNTLETGVRFLDAYTYDKIPNSILEASSIAKEYIQQQHIINQNTQTNEKLDNIDNTINDNSVDNPNFEEFEQYIADNGVITQLITLPVRLYTQILNNVNTTCTPFNLGVMFGHNLSMECIEPSAFFGTALWNTIDILGTGLFIFAISKKMIAVFHQFTNLEEGDILD